VVRLLSVRAAAAGASASASGRVPRLRWNYGYAVCQDGGEARGIRHCGGLKRKLMTVDRIDDGVAIDRPIELKLMAFTSPATPRPWKVPVYGNLVAW
jgi:hypothetical protein